ncbi:methyltransferase domain-containing protein [Rhodobium gokarnense]|uniref:SAM-dependent methyltransferase n=1 Tax=Rhodobium gokarnense TaxID=364296 RepID=A0ABT3HC61_9HYPH|nr:methyltransferase domain-containing protein [Rhodobium gokarnense]MCW2307980.1 SAM-dependent methyltransferase [Rhodobium gokarnense]
MKEQKLGFIREQTAKRFAGVSERAFPTENHPQFITNSDSTLSLLLSRDGSTVRKVINCEADGLAGNTLNEALFYLTIADNLPRRNIVVPKLFGARLVEGHCMELDIEFLDGTKVLGIEDKSTAAFAFGKAAAFLNHAVQCEENWWLPRSSGVGNVLKNRSTRDLEDLLALVSRPDLLPDFQAFQGQADAINAMYDEGYPTICHGDANDENIRRTEDGSSIVAFDWARVCAGRVGDDLARILYPALIVKTSVETADALKAAERDIVDQYMNGVNSERIDAGEPMFDRALVERCAHIKTVALSFGIVPLLRRILTRLQNSSSFDGRLRTAQAFLELMAERARCLTTEGSLFGMTTAKIEDRYYGSVVSEYDKARAKTERWWKEDAAVRKYLEKHKTASVLDLPVGTGRFISAYKALEMKLTGIDVSDAMLDRAREFAEELDYHDGTFATGDALKPQPPEFECDVGVCMRFLNWMARPNAEMAFKNIAAASRQAMIFGVTFIDESTFEGKDRARVERNLLNAHSKPVGEGLPPNGPHSMVLLREWIEQSGFTIQDETVIFEGKNGLENKVFYLVRK